jgi:hypothetical protein
VLWKAFKKLFLFWTYAKNRDISFKTATRYLFFQTSSTLLQFFFIWRKCVSCGAHFGYGLYTVQTHCTCCRVYIQEHTRKKKNIFQLSQLGLTPQSCLWGGGKNNKKQNFKSSLICVFEIQESNFQIHVISAIKFRKLRPISFQQKISKSSSKENQFSLFSVHFKNFLGLYQIEKSFLGKKSAQLELKT